MQLVTIYSIVEWKTSRACDCHSNGKSCSGSRGRHQGRHWTWLRLGFEVVGVKVGINLVGLEVGDAVGFMVVGWEVLKCMHFSSVPLAPLQLTIKECGCLNWQLGCSLHLATSIRIRTRCSLICLPLSPVLASVGTWTIHKNNKI